MAPVVISSAPGADVYLAAAVRVVAPAVGEGAGCLVGPLVWALGSASASDMVAIVKGAMQKKAEEVRRGRERTA